MSQPNDRTQLEPAQSFPDSSGLNLTFKSLAYTFALGATGMKEAQEAAQEWLTQAQDKADWANLAGVFQQMLAGERNPDLLLAEANGLDQIDRAIVALTLAAITDPERLAALRAEISAQSQNTDAVQTQSGSGLNPMQQRLVQVLGAALMGLAEARQVLEIQVLPLFEEEKSDYQALATVIRRMLAGEVEEARLLDPANGLDEIDQEIVHLSLSLTRGGTSMSPIEAISDEAEPQTEAQYQAFMALLVTAAQGEAQARATVIPIIGKMQEQPETLSLATRLERLIVEGERNRANLTDGLDEEDAALVEVVLDGLDEQL